MAIQIKRDTAANFTSNDPTLADGQPGYETDTGKMKIGDGSTAWTSLGYFSSGGTPGGSDTQVQFNDSSAFGGDADFTYDKTTGKLTINPVGAGDTALNITHVNGATQEAVRITNTTAYGAGNINLVEVVGNLQQSISNSNQYAFYAEGVASQSNKHSGAIYSKATKTSASGTGVPSAVHGIGYTNIANADVMGGQFWADCENSTTSEGFGLVGQVYSNADNATVMRAGVVGLARPASGAISAHGGYFALRSGIEIEGAFGASLDIGEVSCLAAVCLTDDVGFIIKLNSSQSEDAIQVTSDSGSAGDLFAVDENGQPRWATKTPASASDTGAAGQIAWDGSFIYVCTATNTWERAAIASW